MGNRQASVRAIIRAVKTAGGQITRTSKGHLMVRGPLGLALIAPDLATPRHRHNARAELRRAGLEVEL